MSDKQMVTIPAGEMIFRQGYPADDAYVIQSGYVEIFEELENGGEKRIAVLKDGEMFGEIGVMDEAPRSASARALKDCVLQVLEL